MATLPDLPQTEIAILEMTNAFRKESRLGEVKPNAALAAAARAFAAVPGEEREIRARGRRPPARPARRGLGLSLLLHRREPGHEPRQPRLRDPGARAGGRRGLEELARPPRQHAAADGDGDRCRGCACSRRGPEVHLRAAVRPAGGPEGAVPHREPGRCRGALRAGRGDAHAARACDRHAYELRSRTADLRARRRRGAAHRAARRGPLRGAPGRGRRHRGRPRAESSAAPFAVLAGLGRPQQMPPPGGV